MMTALSVNCRRAAALNPLSTITNNTYEELAAQTVWIPLMSICIQIQSINWKI